MDGDGTLWVQGLVSVRCATGAGLTYTVTTNYPAPIQVCCETNWVGFDRAGNPLDERGEVWTVFAAPPNPAASIQAIGNPLRSGVPVPLGTNHDWTALDSTEDIFLATRSDGSLWGWGRLPNPGIGPPYYHGTQICLETNWIGFTRLFGRLMARNSDGEIWLPTGGSSSTAFPSPATSMSALGVLFASGVSSNQQSQLAPSFAPNLIRYEIHTNGTLWTVPYKFNLASVFTKADQADPRTNWVAVTTAGITTFGLTADGTLWTWGMDLSEKPQAGLRSRLAARFPQFSTGASPALSGIPSRVDGYPYRPKPRPLMKLQPAQ